MACRNALDELRHKKSKARVVHEPTPKAVINQNHNLIASTNDRLYGRSSLDQNRVMKSILTVIQLAN